MIEFAHDSQHIPADVLLDLWEGHLSEEDQVALEKHVLQCKFCLDLLAVVGAQMPPETLDPKKDS